MPLNAHTAPPDFAARRTGGYTRHSPVCAQWYGTCSIKQKQRLMHPFGEGQRDIKAQDAVATLALHPGCYPGWLAAHLQRLVIRQQGALRRAWDLLTGCTAVVVGLTIPMWIAYYASVDSCTFAWPEAQFNSPPGQYAAPISAGWLNTYNSVEALFWMDVVANFFTSRPAQDTHLFLLPDIARDYLRKDFWLDVVALLPLQCIFLAASSSVNWYNYGFVNRMLRLYTFRYRIPRALLPSPPVWLTYALQRVLRVAALLLVLCQVYCCLTWWVVRVQDFGLPGPVLANAASVTWPVFWKLPTAVVSQQWLFGLMNSVSTFIGNTLPPAPPITFSEMLAWLVADVVLYSTWLVLGACITALLFAPDKPVVAYSIMMDDTRETLQSDKVDAAVVKRVVKQLKLTYGGSYIQQDAERALLQEIPYPLLSDVASVLYEPYMAAFPLFQRYPLLLESAVTLVRRTYFLKGETIVRMGFPEQCLYFVMDGLVSISVPSCLAHRPARSPSAPSTCPHPPLTQGMQVRYGTEQSHGENGAEVQLTFSGPIGCDAVKKLPRPGMQRLSQAVQSRCCVPLRVDRQAAPSEGYVEHGTGLGLPTGQQQTSDCGNSKDMAAQQHGGSSSPAGLLVDGDPVWQPTAFTERQGEPEACCDSSLDVEVVGKQGWFGEATLLGLTPASSMDSLPLYSFHASLYTAAAVTDCVLLALPAKAALPLLTAFPAVQAELAAYAQRYNKLLQDVTYRHGAQQLYSDMRRTDKY